jgi:asparagine synthase (glutamine-hydrolysing)
MAASLEMHVPLLDKGLLLDYVVCLPGKEKMPWGKKMWLLKKAVQEIVPQDVLYGPKTKYRVTFDYWLRTSLKPLVLDHLARFRRSKPEVLKAAKVEAL